MPASARLLSCPGCLETGAVPFGTKNGYPFSRCRACGTAFAQRNGAAEEIGELYDHYYDCATFEMPAGSERALTSLVRSLARQRSTGKWLDVGYGEGGLLSIAARDGWSCHGVEVSPAALEHGRRRGWEVTDDPGLDPRFAPGSFDVVTMIEFLEHVSSPDEHLKAAARWLRPGGVLYLTTPNCVGLNGRLLGVDWSIFSPPEHMVIWTPRGLRAALSRCGFQVARLRTTGFNPYEVYRRIRATSPAGPTMSRNDAGFALNASFTSSPIRRVMKDVLNTGLSSLRLGDDIKVWAVHCRS